MDKKRRIDNAESGPSGVKEEPMQGRKACERPKKLTNEIGSDSQLEIARKGPLNTTRDAFLFRTGLRE